MIELIGVCAHENANFTCNIMQFVNIRLSSSAIGCDGSVIKMDIGNIMNRLIRLEFLSL